MNKVILRNSKTHNTLIHHSEDSNQINNMGNNNTIKMLFIQIISNNINKLF